MSDLTIRPTAKFLKLGTILAVIVFGALEYGCIAYWNEKAGTEWIMVAPALLLLWPAQRALQRRLNTTTITADRLRYESGGLSKSTRTIQLAKVQDVRVDQRLMQRMFNVGNLSIETAGEASRLTIHNADQPQALADEILNRAQKGAPSV